LNTADEKAITVPIAASAIVIYLVRFIGIIIRKKTIYVPP
jgi:hypothetical protein